MDQFVALVNRLVTAIGKVNTSIQKLGDYVSANTYALGTASVIEVVAVSAIEASTKIAMKLISSVASAATIVGALKVATKLRSSAAGISAIAGLLISSYNIRGLATGVSAAEGVMIIMWTGTAQGTIDAVATTDGDLDVGMKLVGASSSQGLCGGALTGIA